MKPSMAERMQLQRAEEQVRDETIRAAWHIRDHNGLRPPKRPITRTQDVPPGEARAELDRKIRELHAADLTDSEISRRVGCARTWVGKTRRRLSLGAPGRKGGGQ